MTEIATTKTFQDKMFERIRDSIGDLMTDEDLKKLVDTAMHKAFFEERTVTEGYHTRKLPPVFLERFQEMIQPMVDKATAQYIQDHKEEFEKLLQARLDKGFVHCLTYAVNTMMNQPMMNLAVQFEDRLRQMSR